MEIFMSLDCFVVKIFYSAVSSFEEFSNIKSLLITHARTNQKQNLQIHKNKTRKEIFQYLLAACDKQLLQPS